jgi:molybdopterin-binding protein
VNLYTIEKLKLKLGGREVLNIPRFTVPEGGLTALTGPNGSGKTSLLLALSGLLRPTEGKLLYRDKDIHMLSAAASDRMRRELGIVLQSPYLFKTSVLKNISYGLVRRGMPRMEAARKAERALMLVGLEGFGKRDCTELSGGEGQRVVVARALVLEPKVLLLDEPFANVDTASRAVIEKVLLQQNHERSTSIIFTTHDLEQASRVAGSILTLYEGQVQEDSLENLFNGIIRKLESGPVFDTGRIRIAIPADDKNATTASIQPESILISLTPASSGERNTFSGPVIAASSRNGAVDVTIQAGEILVARIDEDSYRELGLTLGREVYLTFKAESVRLF